MPLRQLRNKSFVTIRRSPAQLMIQMHDAKHDAEFRLQFEKKPKQRDRVRSARNRHADAISRAKKRLVVRSAPNRGKHRQREF